MKNETSVLVKKQTLNSSTFCITFKSPTIAREAKPGQFINVSVENCTLRRPFSIYEVDGDYLKVVFQIRGCGTKKMASWNEGDLIEILGPLGNGFSELNSNDNVLIVGGGIGCCALFELAKKAFKLTNFCYTALGFKDKNNVILKNEFEKLGTTQIYTQDGSVGTKGFVTTNLLELCQKNNINKIASCGPFAMMEAIFKIVQNFSNISYEVCLEERMACGIGACLGCQRLIKKQNKIYSAHVCCDGPVFNANEVFFEE